MRLTRTRMLILMLVPAAIGSFFLPRHFADGILPNAEVRGFAERDRREAAPADAPLFVGGSSLRRWDTAQAFPGRHVVDHAFNGATTHGILANYSAITAGRHPGVIVLHVGENDIAEAGKTPVQTLATLEKLIRRLRRDHRAASLIVLSLKPSPARWNLWPQFVQVNAMLESRARDQGYRFINVSGVLLGPDGKPDPSLYVRDGIHLNSAGYHRWQLLLEPFVK